ncbi:LuxR C-terminal-related transcriptional regulator [Gordonia sp. NPDC003429]
MTAPAQTTRNLHFSANDARRRVEADARRREALARLAARRMPLPGQPTGTTGPSGPSAGRRMHLVPDAADSRAETRTTADAAVPGLERPNLTAREVEVLRTWLMVDTKPAVAQELFISLGTVNTHLTRIRAKYAEIGRAAPTKAGLVARAVQDGLVRLEEL